MAFIKILISRVNWLHVFRPRPLRPDTEKCSERRRISWVPDYFIHLFFSSERDVFSGGQVLSIGWSAARWMNRTHHSPIDYATAENVRGNWGALVIGRQKALVRIMFIKGNMFIFSRAPKCVRIHANWSSSKMVLFSFESNWFNCEWPVELRFGFPSKVNHLQKPATKCGRPFYTLDTLLMINQSIHCLSLNFKWKTWSPFS